MSEKRVSMKQSDYDAMIESLNSNSSNVKSILLGLLMGIIGAVLWGIIVKISGYSLGIVAIGVGYMVSQGFIWGGRSTKMSMGIAAGVIALLSIFLGNIITVLMFLGEYWGLTFADTVANVYLHKLPELVISNMEAMDIVFYFIAISTAFRRSYVDENKLNVIIEPDVVEEEI